MNSSKLVYKPLGMALGAVSGVLAGAVFKQVWKVVGHDEDAPDATDPERSWREVLLAAALQGAIFMRRQSSGRPRWRQHHEPADRDLARLNAHGRSPR